MSRILPKRTSTLTACFLSFFGGEIIYLPKTCILAKAFGDPSYVAEWKIHELHWQQLLYCVFDLDWYFKHSIMVLRNCINSHGSRGGRAPLKTLSFSKGKTISPIFDLLFHQESRHFRSIVRFRNMYCIKIGATSWDKFRCQQEQTLFYYLSTIKFFNPTFVKTEYHRDRNGKRTRLTKKEGGREKGIFLSFSRITAKWRTERSAKLLLQMISSHREGPSWATAHLAQMTTQMEKEASPTPISSAVAPTAAPLQDLDAPLNLTKPKSSSSGATASSSSPGSDSHSTGAGSSGQQEQPLAATAPKLFPPGLPMPRNYLTTLPYAGLPPHLSSISSPSKCDYLP